MGSNTVCKAIYIIESVLCNIFYLCSDTIMTIMIYLAITLSGLEPEYYETEVCYIDDCNLKNVQWIAMM